MIVTAGVDVGSGAVKAVVMRVDDDEPVVLGQSIGRIRKRDIATVVDEVFARAVELADVGAIDYVASTGEGEDIPFASGHFYGMTTHARGALFLEPRARFVLDVGALHARALKMDERGKVLDYKMTSQCASGTGQFLENITRYLGVTLAEAGELSLRGTNPEKVSSICAVLAETDVINMVSRGISAPDILRGIHESMAGRFARLLGQLKAEGVVFLTGGLANDVGLHAALREALETASKGREVEIASHPDSIYGGALGAAIWGAVRHRRLGRTDLAWTRPDAATFNSH